MFYSTLNKQWICVSVHVGAHTLYAHFMVTYNMWNISPFWSLPQCVCVCVFECFTCICVSLAACGPVCECVRVCRAGNTLHADCDFHSVCVLLAVHACASVCLPRGAPHVEVCLPSGCLAARCAGTRWVSLPSSKLNHAHLTWLPVALPPPVLVILKVFS